MECGKGTVPLSHREGSANGGGLEGLAEPGGQLLGVTLQIAVELGRGHAAHLRPSSPVLRLYRQAQPATKGAGT